MEGVGWTRGRKQRSHRHDPEARWGPVSLLEAPRLEPGVGLLCQPPPALRVSTSHISCGVRRVQDHRPEGKHLEEEGEELGGVQGAQVLLSEPAGAGDARTRAVGGAQRALPQGGQTCGEGTSASEVPRALGQAALPLPASVSSSVTWGSERAWLEGCGLHVRSHEGRSARSWHVTKGPSSQRRRGASGCRVGTESARALRSWLLPSLF